ncbi:BQ2448_7511 [Microbotryum intermedium]|uniref:BQ2448_7511 protein n=1 Tax=Microbotryum intermedium TaxID=269621 RepID=A0A238FKA4_9BASI|nr:BQ2448_7511 [Microbotryum intermedium]
MFAQCIKTPGLSTLLIPDFSDRKVGTDKVDEAFEFLLRNNGTHLTSLLMDQSDASTAKFDSVSALTKYIHHCVALVDLTIDVIMGWTNMSAFVRMLNAIPSTTPLKSLQLYLDFISTEQATDFATQLTHVFSNYPLPHLRFLQFLVRASFSIKGVVGKKEKRQHPTRAKEKIEAFCQEFRIVGWFVKPGISNGNHALCV